MNGIGVAISAQEPPVEIDIRVEQDNELIEAFGSELSAYINDAWSRAKFSKTEVTERLLQCERQRRGVYDPIKAHDIAKTGGSDIFMRITDVKCRAAYSWITDVMLGNANRLPFELQPAKEPELPPEISASIVDLVRMEMMAFVQAGGEVHPEAFRIRMEQVQDTVMDRMREEARRKAGRMGDKIDDQLHHGGFPKALREFVDDFVTYPTAILKGPIIRRTKKMRWGADFRPIIMTEYTRQVERVSPHDIYPSPNASNVNDGYLIERHRLTRASLESMRGTPGYSDEQIDHVLDRFGDQGFRQWLMGDQERDRLEGKAYSRLYTKDVIEALEYWGSIQGKTLLAWGHKGKLDPYKEYECNVWLIGPFVIKAILNPDPLGRRPYEIAQYVSIPGSFWGNALPEQMRDTQTLCNAAARSLANNMGIASGPQAEVQIDRLPDGEDVTAMYPWKIWQTTSDRTGGGQPAIRFFQPEMNAQSLMNVYQYFSRQADEVTGIPNYVYGSAQSGGAGRTASGLSMLMDNAAKGIKSAISSIDMVVASVVDRLYIHNMIYDQDNTCKGDFKVLAKGAMGLIAKEQLQMRRNEFLQATANPVDLQIVGPNGRAYLLREVAQSLQMDTDKLVPTTEQMQFQQEQMAQMQAMMAQQQQQQQLAAPQALDPAGNPAGGQDANLMQ